MRAIHFLAPFDGRWLQPLCGAWGATDTHWTEDEAGVSCPGCLAALRLPDRDGEPAPAEVRPAPQRFAPLPRTGGAMAFALAAAVAFGGSTILLLAGRASAPLAAALPAAGRQGSLLVVVVVLLGLSGVALVALAGRELVVLRQRPPRRR
jgi:hypothetical protein